MPAADGIDLARKYVCETSELTGDHRVPLCTCQSCDIPLCCDASPYKQASRYFRKTGHPVVTSAAGRALDVVLRRRAVCTI